VIYQLYFPDASLVSIATSYGMDGWGSTPGRGNIFFSIPQRADWF
jgi:hypothetical protein